MHASHCLRWLVFGCTLPGNGDALSGRSAKASLHLCPKLSIQYADYALWQRNWLQGEVLQKQLTYWEEHLAGLAPLELPTDFIRPLEQRYQGAHLSFQLEPELSTPVTCTEPARRGYTLHAPASSFPGSISTLQWAR